MTRCLITGEPRAGPRTWLAVGRRRSRHRGRRCSRGDGRPDLPARQRRTTYARRAKLVDALGRRCMPLTVDVRDGPAVNAASQTGPSPILGKPRTSWWPTPESSSTGPLDEVKSDGTWPANSRHHLEPARFNTLRAAIPVMRQQEVRQDRRTLVDGGRGWATPNLAAYQTLTSGVSWPAEVRRHGRSRTEGITVNVDLPTTTANTDGAPSAAETIPPTISCARDE